MKKNESRDPRLEGERIAPEAGAPGARRASTGRLHSPTREALLRRIERAERAVSIAELAAETGWHGNTVRGHVHALWRDGYLSRDRDGRAGQGRPSWLWSTTPRSPGEPYAALAGALAGALERESPEPGRAAREAGRDWGRALGAGLPRAATHREARLRVIETMRDQGFAPVEGPGADGKSGSAVALRQCPLIEAAAGHPGVVCTVHLGLVEGLLEATAPAGDAPLAGGVELTPFSAPGECALRFGAAA